ncbi:hypothetical protein MT962_000640 [Franconibacter sp. IITDAS19]|uniref:hypothetical protein n=1 Tax=Franconibacter sp. IITDAS19 TaxID=2930569 RepID=UPI001FF9ECC0|nr:hypothetical protein [Franconibacter sp. IITDAS19]MCK1966854.1 hypothetical protein [Franconibacter sp. IITDAS19]
MTGTANHIPEPDMTREERIRNWIGVLIIITSYLGVFAGGVASGYFYFRSETLPRTEQRDKTVNEIKQKLDTLPEQTAKELKATEKGDLK